MCKPSVYFFLIETANVESAVGTLDDAQLQFKEGMGVNLNRNLEKIITSSGSSSHLNTESLRDKTNYVEGARSEHHTETVSTIEGDSRFTSNQSSHAVTTATPFGSAKLYLRYIDIEGFKSWRDPARIGPFCKTYNVGRLS